MNKTSTMISDLSDGHVHEATADRGPFGQAEVVLYQLRADDAFVETVADYWMAMHAFDVGRLADGTVIVIDLVSGQFVTAASRLEGLDSFQVRFGVGKTVGWLHEVGNQIVIGGGLGENVGRR